MRLTWLVFLTVFVTASQLRTTLLASTQFKHPSPAALFVESLYHVSPTAYCSLLNSLSQKPVPLLLNEEQTYLHLLGRTQLNHHDAGLLWLSLAIKEFVPAAAVNAVSTQHNCSIEGPHVVVSTDFSAPFEYTERTIVIYISDSNLLSRRMLGYGAELSLKRTDYLVIDDSNPTLQVENGKKVEPLKKNQMSDLGLRAVTRILNADDPLETLEDISQNFPMRAHKLLGAKLSPNLRKEIRKIRELIQGDMFLVNGIETDANPKTLLPILRRESRICSLLQELGLTLSQSLDLMTADIIKPAAIDRFDARSSAVVYLNDFEEDTMYARWPDSIDTFLQPLYPGQFHTIRRNVHTVILNLDLTKTEDLDIMQQMSAFVRRGLPIRWGIVPEVANAAQLEFAKSLKHTLNVGGLEAAVELITNASNESNIEKVQQRILKPLKKHKSLSSLSYDAVSAKDWIRNFGKGNIFTNGRHIPKDESWLQRISAAMRDDTMAIQEALIEAILPEEVEFQDWFLRNAHSRFSASLFGDRSYLAVDDITRENLCRGDIEIVLSGAWDLQDKFDDTDPCVTKVEGPRQLVVNGRIIDDLVADDLLILLDQETAEVERMKAQCAAANVAYSSRLMTILRTTARTVRTAVPPIDSKVSHFTHGSKEGAFVELTVFVDPLSKNAQRWSTVLRTVSQIPGVYIHLQLIPQTGLKELPIKSFYRYLLPAKPLYDEQRKSIEFKDIPTDLLVFGLDTWDAWVVTPVYSPVDLDNLHLGDNQIDAEFELTSILVEGHAKETRSSQPPRGAQLTLKSADSDQTIETIIMANLGYFQFKATPGVWKLNVKEGRSSKVFDLEEIEVDVTSWAGTTIYPKLTRKAGQEAADVLIPSETSKSGLWSALKGFTGSKEVAMRGPKHADINIFTIASGHLYERFVYIMVSSVMAHTNHSVKFWFIDNFLSPQFRKFIPYFAEQMGFEYEMINFAWPHWLRHQTEKQRVIWGYKILFLDVMFPLDLEKVIFVDADQIVRTDLIELVNEDLEGKVWGYTPMCDSRKEIEGFRFWKQGYWKDFLKGKPYHISALYVIDLVAFRAQATGDRLRQQYHMLSADPASLSNLDQDLPNNLQHQIPIHSLKQDWLWCETWCSDESLKTAKTIDMCQNPMTKEPKLDRARRQVPEWNKYDREVKELAKRLSEGEMDSTNIGSIVSEVDDVGQNVEMKREVEMNEATEADKHDEL